NRVPLVPSSASTSDSFTQTRDSPNLDSSPTSRRQSHEALSLHNSDFRGLLGASSPCPAPHNGNSKPIGHTNAQIWKRPERERLNRRGTKGFTWGIGSSV